MSYKGIREAHWASSWINKYVEEATEAINIKKAQEKVDLVETAQDIPAPVVEKMSCGNAGCKRKSSNLCCRR